jgi:hypothetical protein
MMLFRKRKTWRVAPKGTPIPMMVSEKGNRYLDWQVRGSGTPAINRKFSLEDWQKIFGSPTEFYISKPWPVEVVRWHLVWVDGLEATAECFTEEPVLTERSDIELLVMATPNRRQGTATRRISRIIARSGVNPMVEVGRMVEIGRR